jgi:hypothetical protein
VSPSIVSWTVRSGIAIERAIDSASPSPAVPRLLIVASTQRRSHARSLHVHQIES